MQVGETVLQFHLKVIKAVVCIPVQSYVHSFRARGETTFSNDFSEEQNCNGRLLRLHVLAGCFVALYMPPIAMVLASYQCF